MIRTLLLILFCLSLVEGRTQQLQLLAKPKAGNIYLRWSPSTAAQWDLGNSVGYKVTRETVRRGKRKLAAGTDEQVFTFKLASKAAWEELAKSQPYAKVPKGYLFDDPISPGELTDDELKDALNGRMIFTLLAADLSFEVAQALGLAFIDATVEEGQTYRYTVQFNTPNGKDTQVAANASLEDPYFIQPPQELVDADYADSTVTLTWKVPEVGIYSAYVVEKSSDGGANFLPADETPYLPLGGNADLSEISYGHKVEQIDRFYHFRVRGIDPFGDAGPASNEVRFYAFQSRISPPENVRHVFPSNREIVLTWEFPDSLKTSIKGYHVYRNFGPEEVTRISEKTIEKDSPIFKGNLLETDQNILYKITAIDLRGRETFSAPYTVTIIDSIAPQKVFNLEGEINEEGVVKICWNIPPEKDIYAYDIQRAEGNFRNLLYPVAQVFHKDRNGQEFIAFDTVTVGKGTFPYLYYQVIPSDNNTNYTELNDSLKLYRPDVEPPLPPQFERVSYNDSTVTFRFIPSASMDVERYEFYKYYLPDSAKTLLKTISPDSLSLGFTDIAADEEVPMLYILEAFDGVGNTSGDSCKLDLTIPKPFARPPVKNMTVSHDKAAKTNLVKWQYRTKRPVITYWVNRQTNEEGEFERVATLTNGETEWIDKDIRKNTTYAYRIYAVCDDKTRSATGESAKIVIK